MYSGINDSTGGQPLFQHHEEDDDISVLPPQPQQSRRTRQQANTSASSASASASSSGRRQRFESMLYGGAPSTGQQQQQERDRNEHQYSPSRQLKNDFTFSGGIQAKLTALPTAATAVTVGLESKKQTIAIGGDVTIRAYIDPRSDLAMLEVTDQLPRGFVGLLCRYAFLLITGISHGNTKRGIAVEIKEKGTQGVVRKAIGPPNILLQLSFEDSAARERVINALEYMWHRENERHDISNSEGRAAISNGDRSGGGPARNYWPAARSPALAPPAVAPLEAATTSTTQLDSERVPARPIAASATATTPVNTGSSSTFAPLLSTIRNLQDKTRSVLTELRREDMALYSADGEFNIDGNSGETLRRGTEEELRAWAFCQLKRRDELRDAEKELQQIQQRRALRRATLEDSVGDIFVGTGMSSSSSPTALPSKRASAALVSSPPRASDDTEPLFGSPLGLGVCPHCRQTFSETQHIPRCPQRRVRCKNCRQEMKAKDMKAHLSSGPCAVIPSALAGSRSQREQLQLQQQQQAMPTSDSGSPRMSGDDDGFMSLSPPGSPTGGSRRISFVEPRQQQQGQGGAPRGPSPINSLSQRGPGGGPSTTAAALAPNKQPPAVISCPHCYRQAPESHVPRCSYRSITCKRCGETLTARDKVRHDEMCRALRKTYPPAASGSQHGKAASPSRTGEDHSRFRGKATSSAPVGTRML